MSLRCVIRPSSNSSRSGRPRPTALAILPNGKVYCRKDWSPSLSPEELASRVAEWFRSVVVSPVVSVDRCPIHLL